MMCLSIIQSVEGLQRQDCSPEKKESCSHTATSPLTRSPLPAGPADSRLPRPHKLRMSVCVLPVLLLQRTLADGPRKAPLLREDRDEDIDIQT